MLFAPSAVTPCMINQYQLPDPDESLSNLVRFGLGYLPTRIDDLRRQVICEGCQQYINSGKVERYRGLAVRTWWEVRGRYQCLMDLFLAAADHR